MKQQALPLNLKNEKIGLSNLTQNVKFDIFHTRKRRYGRDFLKNSLRILNFETEKLTKI